MWGQYEGTRSKDMKRFHVVGVLVADTDDSHLYSLLLHDRAVMLS